MLCRTTSSRLLPYLLGTASLVAAACSSDDDSDSSTRAALSDGTDEDVGSTEETPSTDDTDPPNETDPTDAAETNVEATDSMTDVETGPGSPMIAEPSDEAAAVLEAIEDYEEWGLFAENEERMESTAHAPGGMNMWVLSYRNDIVATAEAQGTLPLPDGSLIVKENYPSSDAPTPMALTIMSKQDGAWFWLQSTPNGEVLLDPEGNPMEGTDVPMCVTCHTAAEENDFVYLHDFSEPTGPMTVEPDLATQEVLDSIEGYVEWNTFDENSELMQSSGHIPNGNAMFVISYKNAVVDAAEQDGTLPLPDGSLIVKENYPTMDAPTPMALTVMAKRDGAWFWLQSTPGGDVMLDPDGNPMAGADVPMCVTCHAAVEGNDYVYLHDFGAPAGGDAGVPDAGE